MVTKFGLGGMPDRAILNYKVPSGFGLFFREIGVKRLSVMFSLSDILVINFMVKCQVRL